MTITKKRWIAASLVGALSLAACGSSDDDDSGDDGASEATSSASSESDTSAAPDATTGSDDTTASDGTTTAADDGSETTSASEPVSLAGACPDTVVVQVDWMPQAEHGFVYQMMGDDYEIDAGNAYVTGTLNDPNGNDTGVKLQVRSGGAPQNFTPVSQIMYTDDDILLGYVYTDEGIQFSGNFPTVAIESGFEKNAQIIMWDPATYPEVEKIVDLGATGAVVRYFGGAVFMDYFTGSGILSPDQVDGSYSGDPSLFVADEGAAAQQAFVSAEPYIYENEIPNWMKPVAYEYVNDVGWENYGQSIATKQENIETYAECFTKLVPIIQQSAVDYLNDPTRTNAIILDAVAQFGDDFGWTYTQGVADYAVETMKRDSLVANGPDDVVGNFDMDRVNGLIEIAVPIYEAQGASPKEGVTAEDVVTNQFIDDSIGF